MRSELRAPESLALPEHSTAFWSELIGITPNILRRRLRLLPREIALSLPRYAHVDPTAEPGAPRAWTWVLLAYEDDPWAQHFVATHPGGASLEVVGVALGMGKERIRQIEEVALDKLREAGGVALLQKLYQESTSTDSSTDEEAP